MHGMHPWCLHEHPCMHVYVYTCMHTQTFMHACVLMHTSWMRTMHWTTRNMCLYTARDIRCIHKRNASINGDIYICMYRSELIDQNHVCMHASMPASMYAFNYMNACLLAFVHACFHTYCSVMHITLWAIQARRFGILALSVYYHAIIAHMNVWIPWFLHAAHTQKTVHVFMLSLTNECMDLYNVM